MKVAHVIQHFGNKKRAADALGISHVAVGLWKVVVPIKTAIRIHRLTGIPLELEDYDYEIPERL
jgi:hypothetical protein